MMNYVVPGWNINIIIIHHTVGIVRKFYIAGKLMFAFLSSMVSRVFRGIQG